MTRRALLSCATIVAVVCAACGGGGTTSAPGNRLPVLEVLTPSLLNAGSGASTVRVSGKSFLPDSRIRWDGAERPTRYISATELEFDVSAIDLASMDTALVVVFNPPPGGGSSGVLPFIIGYPTPTVASVSPPTFAMGTVSVFLTITGTGFTNRTLVYWDAETAGFAANVTSSTQMRVQIPNFEYPTPRTYTIGVRNPGPGGGQSNRLSIAVTPAP